jgi:hypothetical protein
MRRVVGSLLLSAFSTACLPPHAVSSLGPNPDIGLRVTPGKGGQQLEVTLARPAYLVAVEVILKQGASVVATSPGSEPVAPGQHSFTIQSRPLTMNGVTATQDAPAGGAVEPCPVQPFYEEVRSGDSTRIVFNTSMPTQPQTAPLMCNTIASSPLTTLPAIPPDRYVLVIASSDSIGLVRASQWLDDEDAAGEVRAVLDRIAHGVVGPGAAWSATAYRVR